MLLKPQGFGLENDHWRILAAEDDTKVETVPPQTPVPVLNAGEWFEFASREHFEIVADKPILVGQFLASEQAPEPNLRNIIEGRRRQLLAGFGDNRVGALQALVKLLGCAAQPEEFGRLEQVEVDESIAPDTSTAAGDTDLEVAVLGVGQPVAFGEQNGLSTGDADAQSDHLVRLDSILGNGIDGCFKV